MNIEDMMAIEQVIALYSFTFDCGNAPGWADVFVEDGIWEFYGPKTETPSVKLIGSQQLHDFCIKQNTNLVPGLKSMHHQTGVIFDELTENTAKTRVMVIITTQTLQEPGRIYLTGTYHDRWLKTSRGWRFSYRGLKT